MRVAAEFLVEPFVEGRPGEHVLAAVAALEAHGLTVEMGPFGNVTEGDQATVVNAMHEAVALALDNGASRISVSLVRIEGP